MSSEASWPGIPVQCRQAVFNQAALTTPSSIDNLPRPDTPEPCCCRVFPVPGLILRSPYDNSIIGGPPVAMQWSPNGRRLLMLLMSAAFGGVLSLLRRRTLRRGCRMAAAVHMHIFVLLAVLHGNLLILRSSDGCMHMWFLLCKSSIKRSMCTLRRAAGGAKGAVGRMGSASKWQIGVHSL